MGRGKGRREKKNFGGMKKGRIFATAFEERTAPQREAVPRERENIEKVETRDSVCRRLPWAVGDTDESKVRKKASNSYNEEFDPGSG